MILGGALANLRGEKPRRRLSKRLGRVRGGGDAFVRGDWLRRANAANTRDGGGARGEHRRRATAETRANQSRLKFRARGVRRRLRLANRAFLVARVRGVRAERRLQFLILRRQRAFSSTKRVDFARLLGASAALRLERDEYVVSARDGAVAAADARRSRLRQSTRHVALREGGRLGHATRAFAHANHRSRHAV